MLRIQLQMQSNIFHQFFMVLSGLQLTAAQAHTGT